MEASAPQPKKTSKRGFSAPVKTTLSSEPLKKSRKKVKNTEHESTEIKTSQSAVDIKSQGNQETSSSINVTKKRKFEGPSEKKSKKKSNSIVQEQKGQMKDTDLRNDEQDFEIKNEDGMKSSSSEIKVDEDDTKFSPTEKQIDDERMMSTETKHSLKDVRTESKSASKAHTVKRPPLPIRSLGDEEYEEIFRNAINRVMNTPLEDLMASSERPKCSKESNLVSPSQKIGTKEKTELKKVKHPVIKKRPELKSGDSTSGTAVKDQDVKSTVSKKKGHSVSKPSSDVSWDRRSCAEEDEENRPTQVTQKNMLEKTAKKSSQKKKSVEKTKEKIVKSEMKVKVVSSYIPVPAQKPLLTKTSQSSTAQMKKDKSHKNDKCPKDGRPLIKSPRTEKKPEDKVDRKRRMMERDVLKYGTWVQCCNRSCKKWRYLSDVKDPSELPEDWFCRMNKDEDYNKCDKAEQEYDEEEHIYTTYTEGTVVWAKMAGFPWWPAMIEMDPDTEYYFELENPESMFPSHYHVVFFDDRVSRAWLRASCIQPFIGKENLNCLLLSKKSKIPSYKTEIAAAKAKATQALQMDLQERLNTYSFCKRFKGKWGKDDFSSQDHEKKSLKQKHKKSKNVRNESKVELMDDTTVEDLLNDPSSLLSSLDDVLDSLENFTDDSDFVLSDEEERKNVKSEDENTQSDQGVHRENRDRSRRLRHNTAVKGVDVKMENPAPSDDDGQSEYQNEQKETDSQTDSEETSQNSVCSGPHRQLRLDLEGGSPEASDGESQSESLHSQPNNETPSKDSAFTGPHRQLKLDPDVFTMDMDSDGQSVDDKIRSSQTTVKPVSQRKKLTKKKKFSPVQKVQKVTNKTDDQKESEEMKNSQKDIPDSCAGKTPGHEDHEDQSTEPRMEDKDIKQEGEEDFELSGQRDPQEQAVPSTEADFTQSEDLGQDLSLDFDTISKPQSAISVSMIIPAAVGVNQSDEDSDPFELIEE